MPLEPPPNGAYFSLDEAEKAIRAYAQAQQYGVCRKRSKADHSKPPGVRKVWIMCDRGRQPRPCNYERNTWTKKTDCPFEMTVTRDKAAGEWLLRVTHPLHNHAVSTARTPNPLLPV